MLSLGSVASRFAGYGRWGRFACLVLALTLGSVAAAHAQIVTLTDLETRALRTRPSLRANDARIAQARAHVDAARAAYAPVMNFTSEFTVAPGGHLVNIVSEGERFLVSGSQDIKQPGAFTPNPRFGVMLDARGNIYDFGRTDANVDSALAQQRAAQADVHKLTHDIVRDVRAAYVQWATAYALFQLSDASASAARDRVKQTAASIEEGARPSADRLAAQSDSAFAELELSRARATLDNAREDLGFLCVTDLPAGAQPSPEVLEKGLFPAEQRIKAGDPALTALREQRAAAHASARAHDRAFAPIIAAQAQAGLQGVGINLLPLYRVGVSLSVPLWDGGADAAARAAAEARAAELAAQADEYAQAEQHARTRAAATRAEALRRIGIAEELVRLNSARVAQLEEGYPLGAATLAQIADARAALQRAQTERVLAQAMRAEALLGVE